MQRPIKFRACIPTLNKMCFHGKGLTLGEIRRLDGSYFREDVLWLEYTGLKDKNGVEICEGDIVRSVLLGNPELVKDFIIKWEYDETTGAIGFEVLLGENDREVIGNIYEEKKKVVKK